MLIKTARIKEPILDTSSSDKDYFIVETIVAKIRSEFSLWIHVGNKYWKLDNGTSQEMLWKKQRIDKFLKDYSKFPMKRSIVDIIQIAAKL